jgi:hypothetical protein
MKIVIDDKIPYIQGAFETVAEVVYLPGSKTTPEIVKDAHAIVTRTRTICNQQLQLRQHLQGIISPSKRTQGSRRFYNAFTKKLQEVN